MDDGSGAGSETHILIKLVQLFERGLEIEGLVLARRGAELLRQFESEPPDILLSVFHHHLVDAVFEGGHAAAEGHRASRLRLQAECGHFQHGRHACILWKRGNLREPLAQPGFKSGHAVEVKFFLRTAHHRLDGGVQAPEIGSAQCPDVEDIHGEI